MNQSIANMTAALSTYETKVRAALPSVELTSDAAAFISRSFWDHRPTAETARMISLIFVIPAGVTQDMADRAAGPIPFI